MDKLEERLPDNWREPYRSMDASGSPESAGNVAWAWIEAVAAEMRPTPAALHISSCPLDSDGRVITLYDGMSLLAAATIYRDEMNYSVLIRWRSEAADEITRLKGEVAGAQSTLAYLWKWVERGLFDPQMWPADALVALANHPSAPWKHGRWDVDHKPYAEQFYERFPKARSSGKAGSDA